MFFAVSPHRLRFAASLVALLVAASVLSGCAGANSSGGSPSGDTGGSGAPGPQRIVALTPASLETLATLGLADRVVGIAECTCTPEALQALPIVAGYEGVDLEQLIALEPDLVIVGGSGFTPPDAIAAMQTAGLNVLVVDPKGVDGVYATLRQIGDAVGAGDDAAALVDSIRAEIARLVALVPAGQRPKVFYEIDATSTIYGLAPDDYAAELIALAGGVPVTSGSAGIYEISLEALVAAGPEVILLGDAAYGTTAEGVAARPGWSQIPAVADGAIRPIDGDLVTLPGPRLAAALAALIEAIHPDVTLP